MAFSDVYNALKAVISRKEKEDLDSRAFTTSSLLGLKWATSGGESEALGVTGMIVDGLPQVAKVLELVENGLLADVPFIEAWSCPGGCLGGPLLVQDPFWARYHLIAFAKEGESTNLERKTLSTDAQSYRLDCPWNPRPGMRLDEDLKKAMEKLRKIDEVFKQFPGIDCGACGCPNCLALAEDVVQGYARVRDCFHRLKGRTTAETKKKKVFKH